MNTVDRNIAAIHRVRQDADDHRRRDQIVIDHVAHFLGSPRSLYTHLVVYGVLFVLQFSDGFSVLPEKSVTTGGISLIGSLEAIFLAIFVLVNQRRMADIERKSTDLHLQMSLLAENELTRLARLMDLIAQRVGVDADQVKNFGEVKNDIDPEDILARIETHETENPTDSTSGLRPKPPKKPEE